MIVAVQRRQRTVSPIITMASSARRTAAWRTTAPCSRRAACGRWRSSCSTSPSAPNTAAHEMHAGMAGPQSGQAAPAETNGRMATKPMTTRKKPIWKLSSRCPTQLDARRAITEKPRPERDHPECAAAVAGELAASARAGHRARGRRASCRLLGAGGRFVGRLQPRAAGRRRRPGRRRLPHDDLAAGDIEGGGGDHDGAGPKVQTSGTSANAKDSRSPPRRSGACSRRA